jgi:peptidoglycan hydrolase-like protein with peptidoglycan-binding domain
MIKLILTFMLGIAALFSTLKNTTADELPECPGSPPIFLPLSKQPYCSKAGWDNCMGKVKLPGWNGIMYEGIWKDGKLDYGIITYNRSDKYKNTIKGRWKNSCSLIQNEIYVVNFSRPSAHNSHKTYIGKLNSNYNYHGRGTITFSNGTIQDGYFNKGKYVGKTNNFTKLTLQGAFDLLNFSKRISVQKNLQTLGLYNSLIDGKFGPRTLNSLKNYNKRYFKNSDLSTIKKASNLIEALLSEQFAPKVELKPEPVVVTAPKVELKPEPVVVTAPEKKSAKSSKRNLEEEFNLSFYGSFLHSEKISNALFFFGDIEKSDSFEFRKALRNHKIDLIVLSSPGGLVWEGLSIAGIINDKKLNTYIPQNSIKGKGNCASACSFMFFAGENRKANGELGVHQFYSADSSKKAEVGDTQKSAQFTVSEIIGFLNEFGTPPWVYERMFQQSNMYYFKENELLQLETEISELQQEQLTQVEAFVSELSIALEEGKN